VRIELPGDPADTPQQLSLPVLSSLVAHIWPLLIVKDEAAFRIPKLGAADYTQSGSPLIEEGWAMDRQTLATLEQAIEPYRRAGFIITSQSEGAITLAYPRARFNYLLFIILLLIWPLAVLYLISFNNRGSRRVCLRVSSQGQIEESGYSLEVLKRERKRARQIDYFVILPIVIVLFALAVLFLWHLTYGR
jgi:hypothetical protein